MRKTLGKALSLFVTGSLLLMLFQSVLINMAAQTNSDIGGYVLNSDNGLLEQYATVENGWGGTTSFIYNDEVGAYQLIHTPNNGISGKPGRMILSGIETLGWSAQDNPIVAFKVKISNKDITFGKLRWSTTAVIEAQKAGQYGSFWVQKDSMNPTYMKNTDWQVIAVDLRNYGNDFVKGNYWGLGIDIASENIAIPATTVTFDSIGFFECIEKVNEYYGLNCDDGVLGKRAFSFLSIEDTSVLSASSNTDISFDTEVGAMKIAEKNTGGASPSYIQMNFDSGINFADYHYLALHVKTDNTTVQGGTVSARTKGWENARNNGSVGTFYNTSSDTLQYGKSDDWQWVYYDFGTLGNIQYLTGDWISMLISLQKTSTSLTETTPVWIDAIGLFSSEAEVHDIYADANLHKSSGPYYLLELDGSDDLYSIGETDGNTTISYDSAQNALKLTPISMGANPTKFSLSVPSGYEASKYRYLALRVRLENPNSSFGYVSVRTQGWADARNENLVGTFYDTSTACNPKYAQTDNWQIVIFDFNDRAPQFFTGDWLGLLIGLQSANGGTVSSVWIDAVGLFKSSGEAWDTLYRDGVYDSDMLDDKKNYYLVELNSNNSKTVISETEDNTLITYDDAKKALKLTPRTKNKAPTKISMSIPAGYEASEHKILAVRVKLESKYMSFGYVSTRTEGWAKAQEQKLVGTFYNTSTTSNPIYAQTEEWQIVTYDFSKRNDDYFNGDWLQMLIGFQTYAGGSDLSLWVDAIGLFKSESDAMKALARSDVFNPDSGKNNEYLLYTLKTQNDMAAVHPSGDNTVISFDQKEKAVKITSNTTGLNPTNITFNFPAGYKAENYPILAFRVKLSNRYMIFDLVGSRTEDWATARDKNLVPTFYAYNTANNPAYAQTEDWQLVVFDFSQRGTDYFSGDWLELLLCMQSRAGIGSINNIWMDACGIFKTAQQAREVLGYKGLYDPATQKESEYLLYEIKSEPDIVVLKASDDNTVISWDKNEKALKAISKDSKKNCSVVMATPAGLDAQKFPVLAIRTKISNAYSTFGNAGYRTADWATARNEGKVSTWYSYSRDENPYYWVTSEWQLVFFDFSSRNGDYFSGDWLELLLELQKFNENIEAAPVWIDAIGLFRSEEQAAQVLNRENVINPLVISGSKKQYVLDFDSEATLGLVSATGDTVISFDSQQKVMRVTVSDLDGDGSYLTPGRVGLIGNRTMSMMDAESTPIIAMRIKTSTPRTMGGFAYFKTNWFMDNYYSINRLSYNGTEDWQIVTLDCLDPDNLLPWYFTGDWHSLLLDLATATDVSEGDTFLVDWIGIFDCYKSAYDYAGEQVPDGLKECSLISKNDYGLAGNVKESDSAQNIIGDDTENAKIKPVVIACLSVVVVLGIAAVFAVYYLRKQKLK